MLVHRGINFGTDPEAFFEKAGEIIGAEKIIPEDGYGGVVLDGVQFEMHPGVGLKPYVLGRSLAKVFESLKTQVGKFEGVSVSFKPVIEVLREELDSLGEKSRILGCAPSKNVYGHKRLEVDPIRYRIRSAGGHLHLGLSGPFYLPYKNLDERWRLVPILDLIVGNTCVMIDRDPGQVERRKLYGRAGEYREPPHGLEYRTLSNFWLRSYVLAELAMDLSGIAVDILNTALTTKDDLETELMEKVNILKLRKAINKNDSKLARANFEKIVVPFLTKHSPETGPLPVKLLGKFSKFVGVIEAEGLEKWFPEDPVKEWVSKPIVEGAWIRFLEGV